MTETEKMEKGLVYDCSAEEIMSVQTGFVKYMKEYNTLGLGDEKRMEELMPLMFAEVGPNTYVQPPFYANWGGAHVHFGEWVYANFNLTLVDDGHIYIGDHTMIGPNVTIATAGHPILPELREKEMQYNVDVKIGRNVWIGAGAIIVPGVTIGDNTVIGAGSVVTKDIPANVVAVGNPCRVMREINDHDKEYYYKDKKINY
ncbi:MAG: sugar O-acetyltransferase [Oscillospiraceae bacterium]|nr:sugar O-acetyltransferase [Oscillospiraceae bacterium]